MNKELFDSMQKQMTPSPEVRAALSEKLAVKKRPVPWMRYGAVAACAALVIGGFSVYRLSQDSRYWAVVVNGFQRNAIVGPQVPLHSYVTVEDMAGYVTENASAATGGAEGGTGDQDMGMTPSDLEQAMLDVGYTQAEVDEYQSIGWQMTWAKWWKFVHEQENSEGDEPFNLAALKSFSQRELYAPSGALPAPNAGDLYGGAYVGDVPVQEGAEAYQNLMARFNGTYPDWYGGAYLDNSGWLVVLLVENKDPGDKTLELQVLDWADSDKVMFTSCKYSLAQLNKLMDQLNALPDRDMKCGDVMAGWGIDEEANRIELTLTEVNNYVLSVLAGLDPADDMILVQVGQRATADVDAENPAAYHTIPGGAIVEDDADLIAVEPWVDDVDGAHYAAEDSAAARRDILQLPEQKQPAVVQSVPEEDTSRFTPAYDPDVGFIYPAQ